MKKTFNMLFNKSIIYTFINYALKVILNPFILIFIPIFLTENVQGYWYTFGSIGALATFADLGFTSIMTQFAAHEYAFLNYDTSKKQFAGKEENLSRIASLFQFVSKWILLVMGIAFVIITAIGCWTFARYEDNVKWLFPWILYSAAAIIDFVIQVILSFFEGCNQFERTQKIKMAASVGFAVVTVSTLYFGGGLYTLGIALIIKSVINFSGLLLNFKNTFEQLLQKVICQVNWFNKFIRLLGKYAVSWGSGYFAFQLFNPLIFSFYGAKMAGKAGYTLSIIQAIYSVSIVWMIVALPQLNMFVEKKEWKELDRKFFLNLWLCLITYGVGSFLWYGVMKIQFVKGFIGERVMSLPVMAILSICYLGQMIIYGLAVYLRAHEEEPYMWLSVFSGVLTGGLTYIFLKYVAAECVFMGLILTYCVTVPWAIVIFIKKRKEWHKE